MLEEAASIVVILRLWRVFKIVEEFSAGASDRQYNSSLSNPGLHKWLSPQEMYQEKKDVIAPLALPHSLEALLTLKSAQRWRYLVKR